RNQNRKHLYFELVEKDEETKGIKAKIKVAIWAGLLPRIEAILKKAENAFELKDGINVKLLGKVEFYPPLGTLSFIAESIDPVYTLGKIAQDRQRLIAELTRSGVLAKNKTLELPAVPLDMGLITAFDSAAYNDFTDELKKSGYAFKVSLARAVMQGKNCEASVCEALEALNALDGLDAIVITRGGGSIAELSCFDSKMIAMAIARSRYPVLTGIGHEINTTVADLAAHTFAKTPTAVAQLLVGRTKAFLDYLLDAWDRVQRSSRLGLEAGRSSLREEALALQSLTRELLKGRKETVIRLSERLVRLPGEFCRKKRAYLRPAALRLQGQVRAGGKRLEQQTEQLKRIIHLRLDRARTKITHIEKVVEFASPKKILRRGFSVTRTASGRLVRSAADVRPEEVITTELASGQVRSVVTEAVKEEGQSG
ncbi:MAG: exodeoxyribonuclease VII large subunit, partial [Candidatus Omnitrophica bacterium]|nr:exodeoxyribonuclease VII large subunit [Candidatus Omnitrophota bacterium]